MVLESSQPLEKRGRGRPRKHPIEKTGTTRKDLQQVIRSQVQFDHAENNVVAVSSAKTVKQTKKPSSKPPHDTMTWEEELAAFERHNNKSGLLTLLVLLLGLGLIGYGMYLKLQQPTTQKVVSKTATVPAVVSSGENDSDEGNDVADNTPTDEVTKNDNTATPIVGNGAEILTDYFKRVQQGATNLADLQDSSFKSLPTLRTYFSQTRLATFAKNTSAIAVQNMKQNTTDPVLTKNPTATAYDFDVVYTLKSDGKEYRDTWRGYTVEKNGARVINGFVFQGNTTTQSPFFQFSKFGIK